MNAQAFRLGSRAYVRIYGGLARHSELGFEALALTVAHEIGHHVAGPPFDDYFNWMSRDDRADEWALDQGLPMICGRQRLAKLIAAAINQLSVVIAQSSSASLSQPTDEIAGQDAWLARQRRLLRTSVPKLSRTKLWTVHTIDHRATREGGTYGNAVYD